MDKLTKALSVSGAAVAAGRYVVTKVFDDIHSPNLLGLARAVGGAVTIPLFLLCPSRDPSPSSKEEPLLKERDLEMVDTTDTTSMEPLEIEEAKEDEEEEEEEGAKKGKCDWKVPGFLWTGMVLFGTGFKCVALPYALSSISVQRAGAIAPTLPVVSALTKAKREWGDWFAAGVSATGVVVALRGFTKLDKGAIILLGLPIMTGITDYVLRIFRETEHRRSEQFYTFLSMAAVIPFTGVSLLKDCSWNTGRMLEEVKNIDLASLGVIGYYVGTDALVNAQSRFNVASEFSMGDTSIFQTTQSGLISLFAIFLRGESADIFAIAGSVITSAGTALPFLNRLIRKK